MRYTIFYPFLQNHWRYQAQLYPIVTFSIVEYVTDSETQSETLGKGWDRYEQ